VLAFDVQDHMYQGTTSVVPTVTAASMGFSPRNASGFRHSQGHKAQPFYAPVRHDLKSCPWSFYMSWSWVGKDGGTDFSLC